MPKTNVHIHLFTADHTPEIQLFYLLWNVFEGMFVRKPLLGVIRFTTEKLGRGGLCLRFLLWLARTFSFIGKMLDEPVIGLVRTVETLTHASSQQIFAKLGITDTVHPGCGAAHEILRRLHEQREQEYPFDAVLGSIAKDLYQLHHQGRGSEFEVTQESLLRKLFDPGQGGGKASFTRIVPLTVNFDCAFSGLQKYGLRDTPDVNFAGQVNEVVELVDELSKSGSPLPNIEVAPFLCIDPRYQPPDGQPLLDWIKGYIIPRRCFRGLKVYPPMGFSPKDERLREIFAWCKAESIPVTSHCSLGGAGLRGLEERAPYAHPDEWRPVLDKLVAMPNGGVFRLNLAHFSDLTRNLRTEADETWSGKIIDLMRDYNDKKQTAVEIYSDISYAWVHEGDLKTFMGNIRKLKESGLDSWVLFGSDWWNYLPDCKDEVEYAANIHLNEIFDAQKLESNADRFLGARHLPLP